MSYLKRKQRRETLEHRPVVAQSSIDALQDGSYSRVELINPIELIKASPNEAQILITTLETQFNTQRLEQLFSDVKHDIITSIAPLGMGAKLAEYDQLGGNVDTTYNVRQNIYATDEAKDAFDNRPDYDQYEYHAGNANYNKKKKDANRAIEEGNLRDDSSGELFKPSPDGKVYVHVEHDVSTLAVHNDPAARLADLDTTELANIDENLSFINPSVNSAKGKDSTTEFVSKLPERVAKKKERIAKLEEKDYLSPQEKKELHNAKNYVEKNEAVDKERMLAAEKEAKKAIDDKVDDTYYTSEKFRDNSIDAATNSAKNVGISVALGKVLSLFMSGIIDEMVDCWKNGKQTESIIEELKVRINRIVKKCVAQWKSIVGTGFGAAVSGFFSELATIFINTFSTTSKRIVTLIREGCFSLLRALKILLFPPEGLTRTEAVHEASKVFTGGMIITAGILAEEAVDTFLRGILPIGSGLVSTIIVGSLVAIVSCLAAYLIDKADLLGVMASKKQDYVSGELDNIMDSEIERTKQLGSYIEQQAMKTPS